MNFSRISGAGVARGAVLCGLSLLAALSVGQSTIRSGPQEPVRESKTYKPAFDIPRPQSGDRITLKRSKAEVSWTTINTNKFFPQITSAVTTKGVKPANPTGPIIANTGLTMEAARQRAEQKIAPAGQTKIGTNLAQKIAFNGIGFTGSFPPDTHMAVGPNHIVEVVNTNIAFFDKKSGRQLFQQPLTPSGFLPRSGFFTFDPRVIFDADSQQFIVFCLDVDFDREESFIHVAVSDDADPRGAWKIAKISTLLTAGFGANLWSDYPSVTSSPRSIVMTFNHFGFTTNTAASTVFVLRREDGALFSGGTGLPVPNGFSQMAKKFVAGNNYPVGVSFSPGFTLGNIPVDPTATIMAVVDDQDPPALEFTDVTVPIFVADNGLFSESRGFFLDAIGDRMMDSSVMGNSLVFALTVNVGPDNLGYQNFPATPFPFNSKIRWAEVDLGNWPADLNDSPTLVQSGDAGFPVGDEISTLIPAIAKNTEGSIAIVATLTSSNSTPRVVGYSRKPSDPLGQVTGPTIFGTSPSFFGNGGGMRWGDYAGIAVDPVQTDLFWGAHELMINFPLWTTRIFSMQVKTSSVVSTNVKSVTPIFGSLVGGNISSFTAEDDSNLYVLDSERVSGRGNYAGYEAVMEATGMEDGFRVSGTLKADIEGVSAFVYAFNRVTNKFDLFTSVRLKTENTKFDAPVPTRNAAPYLNAATNEIVVRVVALNTFPRRGQEPNEFRFSSDRLKLTLNEF